MAEPTSDAEPSSTAVPATDGGSGDSHDGGGGWRQKSNRFLAAVAAASLIVVLLGGMAIGYAIEKGRVKDNKTTAVPKSKKKTPVTVNKKAKVVRPRITGTVTEVSGNKLTITPTKGAKRVVTLQDKTVVVKASTGAASDIAKSTKVLFSGTSFTSAKNVIVLPKTSLIGSSVVKTGADSMSVKAGAKSVTITIKGASVEKAAAAKSSDITKGSKVMISMLRVKGGVLLAVEVIVLPDNSPFA